jgi:tetratricopeptide (TPR) repeat protein
MIPENRNNIAGRLETQDLTREELEKVYQVSQGDSAEAEANRLSDEIEESLQERDIMTLRSQLKNLITQTAMTSAEEYTRSTEAYFGLSEEVFNPVNLDLEDHELEIGNYLQKLHIKNHTVASKEIVHDLFTEDQDVTETEYDHLSVSDEFLFEDISQAVSEKDIIDLRANLSSIAQSTSKHERSIEDIEDFLYGDLDQELSDLIREEAQVNSALSGEISLHREIDQSVQERDIIRLREGLQQMMQNEYSHSRSIEEIEDYLSEELESSLLADFESELIMNSGLASDVAFHREIDKAAMEADVITLRNSLQHISSEEQGRSSEILGLSPKRKSLFWYAAASTIILMIVFTSLLRHKTYTSQQLYTSYYQPYKSGANVSRSSAVSPGEMNLALRHIDNGEYTTALRLLDHASAGTQDGFSINFYSGVANQELGEYGRAISSFSEVVRHGDNLLVEQSQWYIGLCYLRLDERERAVSQFSAIVSGNGYYRDQSKKILKQLE